MTEPQTPGDARRQGLRKSRWVAAGVAVGTAAFLTGVIAGVNGVDDSNAGGQQISSGTPGTSQPTSGFDDGRASTGSDGSSNVYRYGDEYGDDYGSAQPYSPQSGSSQQIPSFQPQTRSRGS